MYKKILEILRKDEAAARQLPLLDVEKEPENFPPGPTHMEVKDPSGEPSSYYNVNDIRRALSFGKLQPAQDIKEDDFDFDDHIEFNNQFYHKDDLVAAGVSSLSHNDYLKEIGQGQEIDQNLHNQIAQIYTENPDNINEFIQDNRMDLNDQHFDRILEAHSAFRNKAMEDGLAENPDFSIDSLDEEYHPASNSYIRDLLYNTAKFSKKLSDKSIKAILNNDFGMDEYDHDGVVSNLMGNENVINEEHVYSLLTEENGPDKNYSKIVNFIRGNPNSDSLSEDTYRQLWSAEYLVKDEYPEDSYKRYQSTRIIKQSLLNSSSNMPDEILDSILSGNEKKYEIDVRNLIDDPLRVKHLHENAANKILDSGALNDDIDNNSLYRFGQSIIDNENWEPGSDLYNKFMEKAPYNSIREVLDRGSEFVGPDALPKLFNRLDEKPDTRFTKDLLRSEAFNEYHKIQPQAALEKAVKYIDTVRQNEEQGHELDDFYTAILREKGAPKEVKDHIFRTADEEHLTDWIGRAYGDELEQIPHDVVNKFLHGENADIQSGLIHNSVISDNKDLLTDEMLHNYTKSDDIELIDKSIDILKKRNPDANKILTDDAAHQLLTNKFDYRYGYNDTVKHAINTLGEEKTIETIQKGIVPVENAGSVARYIEDPDLINKLYEHVNDSHEIQQYSHLASSVYNDFTYNENLPDNIIKDIALENDRVPLGVKSDLIKRVDASSEELEKMFDKYSYDISMVSGISRNPNAPIKKILSHIDDIRLRDHPDEEDEKYWSTEEWDEDIHDWPEDEHEEHIDREFDESEYANDLDKFRDRFSDADNIIYYLGENPSLKPEHIEELIDDYINNYEDVDFGGGGHSENYSGLEELLENPNFNSDHLKQIIDSPYYDSENYEDIYEKVNEMAGSLDPNYFNSASESPYSISNHPVFGEPSNGKIKVHPDLDNLKMIKHFMKDMKQPKKGFVKGQLKNQIGGMIENYPEIFDKSGRTTMDQVEQLIKEKEDQATPLNISFTTWGENESGSNYDGLQRHDEDTPQAVVQVNLTQDMIDKMKEEGVYDTFRQIQSSSYQSQHPVRGQTIGWARIDHSQPGHWHIDEIQSDFGSDLARKLSEEIRSFKQDKKAQEKSGKSTEEVEAMADAFLNEHAKAYKKIQDIISAGHDDANHMIQSAVMQLARSAKDPATNKNQIESISFDDPNDQMEQSGLSQRRGRPVHFVNTYQKRPKKLRFKKEPKVKAFEDWDDEHQQIQYAPLYKKLKLDNWKKKYKYILKNEDQAYKWQSLKDPEARKKIHRIEGPDRESALNTLKGLTRTRVKNGERYFLLHRGMGGTEHRSNVEEGLVIHPPGTVTSWTPDYNRATKFHEKYRDSLSPQKPVSAWIHEKDIHHYLPETGEHEVLIHHSMSHPEANLDNKEEKIEKGLKQAVAAGATGLAMMAPTKQMSEASIQPSPKSNIQQVKGPSTMVEQRANKDQALGLKNNILNAISQVESSGGKNVKHERLPASGMHQGERAYGKFGLTPVLIRETIAKHPDLQEKYGHIADYQGDKLHAAMNENPELENIIASRHYDRLAQHFGHDPKKIGFGWLNGVSGTYRALKGKQPLHRHWHVKKILNAMKNSK